MGYEVHIDWAGGTAFSGTADDVTGYLRSIDISRGRDQAFSVAVPAGAATIELVDTAGRFNPAAPASGITMRPNLPVRIRYVQASGGTVLPLFRGYLRKVTHTPRGGPEAGRTVLECEDLFRVMAGWDGRREESFTPWTAGSAIEDYLTNYIGYGLQSVTVSGGEISLDVSVGADQVVDGLTLIGEIVQAEGGDFYVNGGGTVVYRTLMQRLTASVAGTVTDTAAGVQPTMDLDRVTNRQEAGQEADVTRSADNTASIAVYGVQRDATIVNKYLMGTAGALSTAEYIVSTQGTADVPVERVRLTAGWAGTAELGSTFQTMTRRDIGDRIRLIDTPSRLGTVDVFIERVTHHIEEGVHTTEWGVTPYPKLGTAGTAWTPFQFGVSTLDGTHILVT